MRRIGWKLAFGSPEALARLGLDAPLVGVLTESSVLPDGATVSIADWTQPMLEVEIAVHVGAGLGAAIELVDVDEPAEDPARILAGNIYHRHVILGPPDRARTSADGITARVTRNGEEVARTDDPEALTGRLDALVRHVATHAELRDGDVIIAGAVVPPLPVAPGDRVEVELAPLGSLRVAFAD